MTAHEAVRVTAGRVSAIHRRLPGAPTTLCGRDADGMSRMPADHWAAMGWRAASPGTCQRCDARVDA